MQLKLTFACARYYDKQRICYNMPRYERDIKICAQLHRIAIEPLISPVPAWIYRRGGGNTSVRLNQRHPRQFNTCVCMKPTCSAAHRCIISTAQHSTGKLGTVS